MNFVMIKRLKYVFMLELGKASVLLEIIVKYHVLSTEVCVVTMAWRGIDEGR
jgi:hypothetical protein